MSSTSGGLCLLLKHQALEYHYVLLPAALVPWTQNIQAKQQHPVYEDLPTQALLEVFVKWFFHVGHLKSMLPLKTEQ
jgi:hypothetical protein